MRKALSVLLALSMLLSLCVVPSFAEEAIDETVLVEEEASADGEAVDDEVVLLEEGEAAEEGEGEEIEPDFYAPATYIKEVRVGSTQANTDDTTTTALTDGKKYGADTWHSYPGKLADGTYVDNSTAAKMAEKTVTIEFKSKIPVTGVRLSPRTTSRPGVARIVLIRGIYEFNEDGTPAHTKELFYGDLGHYESDETTEDANDIVKADKVAPFSSADADDLSIIGLDIITLYSNLLHGDQPTREDYVSFTEIEVLKDESILTETSTVEETYSHAKYITSKSVGSTMFGSAANLFDSDNRTTVWHSAASGVPAGLSKAALDGRTVTVSFSEKIPVGGIRIWPRAEWGAAPATIGVIGVYDDGERFIYSGDVSYEAVDPDAAINNTGNPPAAKAVDLMFPEGTDVNIKGIKVIFYHQYNSTGVKVTTLSYVALAGIQFLKPNGTYGSVSGRTISEDEVAIESCPGSHPVSFTQEGNRGTANNVWITGTGNTTDTAKIAANLSNFSLADNVQYQSPLSRINNATRYGFTATLHLDLGSLFDFSGIRLYSRRADGDTSTVYGSGGQNFLEGYLYVSNDGVNWLKSDKVSSAATALGDPLYITFGGVAYDIRARYVNFEVVKSNGTVWAMSELALLKPRGNTLVKLSEDHQIDAAALSVATSIENLADMHPTNAGYAAAVAAARTAYNKLTASQMAALSGMTGEDDAVNYRAMLEEAESTVADLEIYEYGDFFPNVVPAFIGTGTATSTTGVAWVNTTTINTSMIADRDLNTRSEIDNVKFNNGNTAHLIIDLLEDTTFSGLRVYSRRNSDDVNAIYGGGDQSIIRGKVYVADTLDDSGNPIWVAADEIGSASDRAQLYMDLPTEFGGKVANITARYVKLECLNTYGNTHWSMSEVRLLDPVSGALTLTPDEVPMITGESTLSCDITDEEDVTEEEITLSVDTSEVSSVVLDRGTIYEKTLTLGEDYTLSEKTVTLKAALIKELLIGTHTVTVNFKIGIAVSGDIVITDSKQVVYSYVAVKNTGSENLVLTNVKGLEVTGVTVNGTSVDVVDATDIANITITRLKFRQSGLYYDAMPVADEGVVVIPVVVTFSDGSTVTYKVNIVAPWTPVKNVAATFSADNFQADEVAIPDNSDWRVRTDSAVNSNWHPVVAFTSYGKDATWSNTSNNGYHSWYASGSPDVPAAPNRVRYVEFDLGENPPVIGGLRQYPRINGGAADNSWRHVVIKGRNGDSEDWVVLYDSVKDTAADSDGKLDMVFEQNSNYRYYRAELVNAAHATALKIRLLVPITKILTDALTFETGFPTLEEDVTLEYETVEAGTAVSEVTIGETVISDYTAADGTLTIAKEAITDLAVGIYTIKVTFSDGATDEVKLTVTDSSQAEFQFVQYTGPNSTIPADAVVTRTENFTLTNILGLGVKGITLADDTSVSIPWDADATDNTKITLSRKTGFRTAFDVYKYMGKDGGSVDIIVTFEGDIQLTYTINLTAQWVTHNNVPTSYKTAEGTFKDDEIDFYAYEGFRIRTDTAWNVSMANHPAKAIWMALDETAYGTRYHGEANTNGNGSDGKNHYIDIDLGEAKEIGGIRYIARSETPDFTWTNVKIYGSDDYSNPDDWTLLYDKTPTSGRTADLYFNQNTTTRYIRIYLYNRSYHTAHAIRLLKPATKVLEANGDYELTEKVIPQYTFELTGGDEVTAVTEKGGEALVAGTDYTVTTEGTIATLTFTDAYLENLEAGNSFADDLRQGKTFTYTVTVGAKTFDITLNYVNSKVEKYEITSVANSNAAGNKDISLGTGHLIVKNFHEGKKVSNIYVALKSDFSDKVEVVDFNASNPALVEEGAEITIGRSPLRRAIDLYSAIGADKTGEAYVKVVYDDATEVVYTLILSSEWKTLEAADITETEWATDEIPAEEGWKITTSSATNASAHPWQAFAKDAVGILHKQNWHAGHINGSVEVAGATGYYIDVDFGVNATKYMGVRHVERKNGDNWEKVMILGSDDYENWTPLFYGTDEEGNKVGRGIANKNLGYNGSTILESDADIYEYMFNDGEVSYRYLRIRVWNGLPTADEIRIIKAESKVINNSLTLYADPAAAEDRAFYFTMAENLTAENVEVKLNDAVVDAANYNIDAEEGTITFTDGYLATLKGTYTVTFTVAGVESEATLTIKDRYNLTYVLAGDDGSQTTIVGDGDLVLSVNPDLIGKIAAVKSGSVEFTEYTLNEEASTLTIARAKFRRNLDLYRDGAVIELSFNDETPAKYYTIKTTAVWNELGTVTETITHASESWKDDEIVAETTWKVRSDASHSTNWAAANAFSRKHANNYVPDDESDENIFPQTGITSWHSNIGDGGKVRHYFDVDFGEDTTFAGIRYYARNPEAEDGSGNGLNRWDNSGTWKAVNIYGSEDGISWTLIKYADIDEAAINAATSIEGRQADVVFTEAVTYRYARIVVENNGHTTARYISFLNSTAIQTPSVEEEEVVIKADSTIGGTVTVNGGAVAGDTVVAKGDEVTFTATASGNAEFQYWIEVNTGKIISESENLTMSGSVGRKVVAVFDGNISGERFVSFFGKDAKSVIGSGYVGNGVTPEEAGIVPTELKAYVSGYTLAGWKLAADATETVEFDTTSTKYYAHYNKIEEAQNVFTLTTAEGVTVAKGVNDVDGNIEGEGTSYEVLYGTRVTVTAPQAAEGQKFSHWTYDGKVVSYDKVYGFSMPMTDVSVLPVYVAEDATIIKEVSVTLTYNAVEKDNGDQTAFAGLVITRNVPELAGVTTVESGIIYVRDGAYAETLTVDSVGKTSANGKLVNVSLSTSAAAGQYKFNARYQYSTGLTAIAFITYEVTDENGDTTRKTVYSEVAKIAAK